MKKLMHKQGRISMMEEASALQGKEDAEKE